MGEAYVDAVEANVRDTAEKLEKDEPVTGGPTLDDMRHPLFSKTLGKIAGIAPPSMGEGERKKSGGRSDKAAEGSYSFRGLAGGIPFSPGLQLWDVLTATHAGAWEEVSAGAVKEEIVIY